MKSYNMPRDLRNSVRRYLEYQLEQKKEVKIEEKTVFGLLN